MKKLSKPILKTVIGWHEWVSLPDLGVPHIKAKIDTGAKTSAIHAENIEYLNIDGVDSVMFTLHPIQHKRKPTVQVTAPLYDIRDILDSGGKKHRRYVIITMLEIGSYVRPIELSLSQRDQMGFRMLLGRSALNGMFLVDSEKRFCFGRRSRVEVRADYNKK